MAKSLSKRRSLLPLKLALNEARRCVAAAAWTRLSAADVSGWAGE